MTLAFYFFISLWIHSKHIAYPRSAFQQQFQAKVSFRFITAVKKMSLKLREILIRTKLSLLVQLCE